MPTIQEDKIDLEEKPMRSLLSVSTSKDCRIVAEGDLKLPEGKIHNKAGKPSAGKPSLLQLYRSVTWQVKQNLILN